MADLGPVAATRHAANGIVCSVDHLASTAGVAMLQRGGSAADAAVAANAVLAVTSQDLCGMGGDLFALVHAGSGPPAALNASGRAGSGADPDRLRSEGHRRMPRHDLRAVTIPGCVDGWAALHSRFGRLGLDEVLEPARRYAEEGFPVSPRMAASATTVAHLPDAVDYVAGGPLRAGDLVRRPGVARALAAIAGGGRAAYYEGEFGGRLIEVGDGQFSPEDLAATQADWVSPLGVDAFGHRVWTIPPNSQGYLILAGAWIAGGLGLPADPDDAAWAHLLIEAARQAAFDRLAMLHEHADGVALVAPERLGPRRDAIDPDRAAVLGDAYRAGGTTYVCAVDRDRMGVSLIQSNAGGFGSGVIVPGLRIFLQNRGLGFSLEPGHPAEYGPGRRPPHTLCPAVVTDDRDRLAAVLGSMGGDSQPQIVLQLLARHLAVGEPPGRVVAGGRWRLAEVDSDDGFSTWDSGGRTRVLLEGHAPDGWDEGLRRRGHTVIRTGAFEDGYGHAHLIAVDGDRLAGAADPRPRVGAAAGY